MDTLLDLPLHQVYHSLSEVFVHGHTLRGKIVINRPLKSKVGLIVIFLPETKFSDLEESISCVILFIWVLSDLFKVENGINLLALFVLEALGEDLASVKMSFDITILLCDHLLEIQEGFLEHLPMEAGKSSFEVDLLKFFGVVFNLLKKGDSFCVGLLSLFVLLEGL